MVSNSVKESLLLRWSPDREVDWMPQGLSLWEYKTFSVDFSSSGFTKNMFSQQIQVCLSISISWAKWKFHQGAKSIDYEWNRAYISQYFHTKVPFSKGVIWGYAPINNKTRKSDHQRVTWTKNDNKAVCIFAQPHRSCCGHCFDRRPQQHRSGPRALGKAGPRAVTGDPRFRPTVVPRLTQLAIGAWNWGIYPQIWTREWEGPSLHIYTIHVKNLTQCNKKHINRFIVTN